MSRLVFCLFMVHVILLVPRTTSAQSKPFKKYSADGLEALHRKHFAEAEANFKKAEDEAEKKRDEKWRVVALMYLGEAYLAERRFPEADPVLVRSLAIAQKEWGPDNLGVATIMVFLSEAYEGEAKWQEMGPLLTGALAIVERKLAPLDPRVATTLAELGAWYTMEGRFDEADAIFNRSLSLTSKRLGSTQSELATIMNLQAELYEAEGQYALAEPLFHRSLELREKALGPDHPDVAQSLNNLASFYVAQGNYGEAEELFQRSIAIREKNNPEGWEVAQSLANLATVYQREGNDEEAERITKLALIKREKAQGAEHPDVATSLAILATIYEEEGKFGDAELLYKRSQAIREKALGPDHIIVARGQFHQAILLTEEDKFSEAEPLLKSSLTISEKSLGSDHPDVAAIWRGFGFLNQSRGRYAEAESFYARALAIEQKSLGPDNPELATTEIGMASSSYAAGDAKSADLQAGHSMRILHEQFDRVFPYMAEAQRLIFLSTASRLFAWYYSFCVQYGKTDPALIGKMYNVLLWHKGFVGRSIAADRAKISNTNDREALALLEKLTAKRSQLAAMILATPVDPVTWKQNVDQVALETDKIEKELVASSRRFAGDTNLAYATWQDVQASLKPGEAAVELLRFRFHDGKHWTNNVNYVALVVTPETKIAPLLVNLGDAKDIEGPPLVSYQDEIFENPASANAEEGLFRSFWLPIEAALGPSRKVFLSPDGILNLVSLSVIPIGNGRRLLDEYDVRVVSSTKDLLRDTPVHVARSAVLLGDPQFDPVESDQRAAVQQEPRRSVEHDPVLAGVGPASLRSRQFRGGIDLPPLPATKTEIETISSLLQRNNWQVEALMGSLATKTAVEHVIGPTVLHLATHAYFLKDQGSTLRGDSLQMPAGFEDPMIRSGLFFAGASRTLRAKTPSKDVDDGVLTAFEATDLNLQGTELVVLSACDTGLGKVEYGEGVFGLRRAFQEAGAQAVLMSLWAVPDRETQELMTIFYTKWLAGEDKQQAFHDAQQELRARVKVRYGADKPFYWGGFVLVGR